MKIKSLLLFTLILAATLLLGYQGDIFAPPKVSAMDSTRFEYNTGPNSSHDYTTTTRWLSQTFTAEISHTIKSVKLHVKKFYPIRPVLYVNICSVGPNGKPITSEILASGYHYFSSRTTWGAAWLEVSLGDGAPLQAGVTYSIVIRMSEPWVNLFYWGDSTDYYPGGQYYYSTNAGATWSSGGGFDMRFEEWGILLPQEAQIFESYNNTAGPPVLISEPFQNGQTFIPQTRHILRKVFLRGYVPFEFESQLTVKIMSTSEGLPAGEPLSVVSIPSDLLPLPGEEYWISVDIPDEPELQAGVMYAIVVAHNASEPFGYRWTSDIDDEYGEYPGGTLVKSSNGGISWTIYPLIDCCFQEWGYPLEQ